MKKTTIAIIGAGIIGQTHINTVLGEPTCELVGIADPMPEAEKVAQQFGIPYYADHIEMLDKMRPQGVINATPNKLHMPIGIDCIERGIPVIVEKPVAESISSAKKLVQAAADKGVPVLVGHHRRHNPILAKAREVVQSGRLGKPLTVTAMWQVYKPDNYYDIAWRRQPGISGPILVNMVHDFDMLRFIVGEIDNVQAIISNKGRGFEIEDTAVICFHFANDALGTITMSDYVAAPWSWDMNSRENNRFTQLSENCLIIAGTDASLAIPQLDLWYYKDKKGWDQPMVSERIQVTLSDPYTNQLRNLCDVIDGKAQPVLTAADAINTLAVTEAVFEAAKTGKAINPYDLLK